MLKDAILAGNINRLTQLIEEQPHAINTPVIWGDNNQVTSELLSFVVGLPFHQMLTRQKAIAVLHVLLHYVKDVNRRNTNGETPLHGSVSYGEIEMSQMLIEKGADIEARGGVIENGTPLLLATFFGMLECAQLLIDHGATPTDSAILAAMGDLEKLQAQLSATPLDTTALQRAFAFACINGQQNTAALLLTCGVQINEIAYDNLTGLHWTAYRDQPEMAQFLLQKGAQPTILDPTHQSTPLGWAIYHGNDAVRYVLENHTSKNKA